MPLQPGTTLGPYSVTAKIGEGGMGEVYRARDTKLDRDVALKVLPQAFTDDPDRLARFEREANQGAGAKKNQTLTAVRCGNLRALVAQRPVRQASLAGESSRKGLGRRDRSCCGLSVPLRSTD